MSDADEVSELARQLLDLSPDPRCRETTFVVHHAGCVVTVHYTCGSSAGLTLQAPYDHPARAAAPERALGGYRDAAVRALIAARPLDIELRPEDRGDVAAKQQGLSVEWQSGDAAFDAAIYVSTPTTDPAVLAAVLCEPVRRAVLLLRQLGFYTVHIDDGDGNVRVEFQEFLNRTPRPERGRMAVGAFAQILSSLPAVRTAGRQAAAPLRGWTVFFYVCAVGWFLYPFAGVWALADRWRLPVSTGMLVGAFGAAILAGLVGGRVFGRMVQTRARGTSRAHTLTGGARWAGFGGISVIVFSVVFVVGAIWAPDWP